MGCLEKLPYEVLLRYASFGECRDYVKKNYSEIYEIKPGYKIFDSYIIGVPPILVGVDGDQITFPFTKPCHGTFLVVIPGAEEEIKRLKNGKMRYKK